MPKYDQIMLRFPDGSGMRDRLKAEADAIKKPGGGRTTLNEYLTGLIATHPDRVRRKKGGK